MQTQLTAITLVHAGFANKNQLLEPPATSVMVGQLYYSRLQSSGLLASGKKLGGQSQLKPPSVLVQVLLLPSHSYRPSTHSSISAGVRERIINVLRNCTSPIIIIRVHIYTVPSSALQPSTSGTTSTPPTYNPPYSVQPFLSPWNMPHNQPPQCMYIASYTSPLLFRHLIQPYLTRHTTVLLPVLPPFIMESTGTTLTLQPTPLCSCTALNVGRLWADCRSNKAPMESGSKVSSVFLLVSMFLVISANIFVLAYMGSMYMYIHW